ncbi:hypothetical protein ACF1DV_08290 [Streptomyces achromogenes]|uniref:hypothetical protein n=1 Tax=Streptomyces achromogenes TaxID=67255 RepID=UPI0036F9CB7A
MLSLLTGTVQPVRSSLNVIRRLRKARMVGMDPVSVGLLVALASGAGGEAGRQAWAGLGALVRRPFRQHGEGQAPAVGSGEAELVRLAEDPDDQGRAQALSTALAVRAALDEAFRTHLAAWQEQVKLVRTGDGAVTNTVSGGTQHGPVVQGRDFSHLSFTTPSPSSPSRPPSAGTPGDGAADPQR